MSLPSDSKKSYSEMLPIAQPLLSGPSIINSNFGENHYKIKLKRSYVSTCEGKMIRIESHSRT